MTSSPTPSPISIVQTSTNFHNWQAESCASICFCQKLDIFICICVSVSLLYLWTIQNNKFQFTHTFIKYNQSVNFAENPYQLHNVQPRLKSHTQTTIFNLIYIYLRQSLTFYLCKIRKKVKQMDKFYINVKMKFNTKFQLKIFFTHMNFWKYSFYLASHVYNVHVDVHVHYSLKISIRAIKWKPIQDVSLRTECNKMKRKEKKRWNTKQEQALQRKQMSIFSEFMFCIKYSSRLRCEKMRSIPSFQKCKIAIAENKWI